MKTAALRLESLSDDDLLTRLEELVRRSRRSEAELIWHLAEVAKLAPHLIRAARN